MLSSPIYWCLFYQTLKKQPHFHEKPLNTLDLFWNIELMKEIFY